MRLFYALLFLISTVALAQGPDAQGPGGQGPGGPPGGPPPQGRGPGNGGGRGQGRGGPQGMWWEDPQMVRLLGLTPDQRKKMDDIFQQHRVQLIDLRAAVQREEAILDPLMNSAQPDDSKILPQIDRIAQARADLEKADARLQLALRHVLTPEQWQVLRTESPRGRGPGGPGGPGGPPRPGREE